MIFTDGRGSTCHCGQERSERQARPPSPFMAKVRHRPRHKGKLSSLSMFSLCLLVVTSLPSAVQSTIICAHADSTCTNCRTLCGDAQFYPILPSFCHPESRVSQYRHIGTLTMCTIYNPVCYWLKTLIKRLLKRLVVIVVVCSLSVHS